MKGGVSSCFFRSFSIEVRGEALEVGDGEVGFEVAW
jgi:hypothetical protein